MPRPEARPARLLSVEAAGGEWTVKEGTCMLCDEQHNGIERSHARLLHRQVGRPRGSGPSAELSQRLRAITSRPRMPSSSH